MVGEGEKLHTVRVSAPGKVILHGEHSVVYGKTAIAASLGLRTSIAIEENTSSHIKILLPHVDIEEVFEVQLVIEKLFKPAIENNIAWDRPDKIDHDEHLKVVDSFLNEIKYYNTLKSHQKNALRGVFYLMSAILGSNVEVSGMDLLLNSKLTIGAGTGSSASYGVVLAGALIRLRKLNSQLMEFEAQALEADFSADEMDLISSWGFNVERIMHGTPSGIDNATCTFGGIVSFRKGVKPQCLDIRLGIRVLLVDTRVARETRMLTGRVAALRARNMAAVEHVMAAIDDITHQATQVLENLSEKSGDHDTHYQHLAELWNMNHCLLAALGTSHASLERIKAAAAARDLACKLTGAGGGGYAIVLVPPSTDDSVVSDLTQDLLQQGFLVTETSLGGQGVKLDV